MYDEVWLDLCSDLGVPYLSVIWTAVSICTGHLPDFGFYDSVNGEWQQAGCYTESAVSTHEPVTCSVRKYMDS